MKKFLPSILLLCAALMFAQAQKDQQSTQPMSSDNQTQVQGCLSGSAGSYTLTDSSGQKFQLAGDTSKLEKHVGHKVEISGTTSSASAMPGPSTSNPSSSGTNPSTSGTNPASSGSAGSQTLNVSSVKYVSESCDTGR